MRRLTPLEGIGIVLISLAIVQMMRSCSSAIRVRSVVRDDDIVYSRGDVFRKGIWKIGIRWTLE